MAACLAVFLGLSVIAGASAQTAPASKPLVLLPYESPGSTDPHATLITKVLTESLGTANVAVTVVPAIDHIDAVASAAKICADNNASGILVPEGRYEQTKKSVSISMFLTLIKYPTHVEFRLDDVGCDGVVRWSKTTIGDQSPSGVNNVGNLGAAIDVAFHSAIVDAVTQRAAATVAPAAGVVASAIAAPVTPVTTYLLLPFEQPALGDPHASDITHSLLEQLKKHKLDVKVATTPIDHLTAIATATQLCAANAVQAIIVPQIRLEQSSFSGKSHAALRLTSLGCTGIVLGHGSSESDMGVDFMQNFGSAIVGVSERAMGPAIEALFPVASK